MFEGEFGSDSSFFFKYELGQTLKQREEMIQSDRCKGYNRKSNNKRDFNRILSTSRRFYYILIHEGGNAQIRQT